MGIEEVLREGQGPTEGYQGARTRWATGAGRRLVKEYRWMDFRGNVDESVFVASRI